MSTKTEVVVEVVELDSETLDDLEFFSSLVDLMAEPAYNVAVSDGVAKEDNRAWNQSVLDQLLAVMEADKNVAELFATIKAKLAGVVAKIGNTRSLGADELIALRSIIETRVSRLYTPFYNISRIIEIDGNSDGVLVESTKDGSTWTSVAKWALERMALVTFNQENWAEGKRLVHFTVKGVERSISISDALGKRNEWVEAKEHAEDLKKASASTLSAVERQYRLNHPAGMVDGRTKEASATIAAVVQSGVEARAAESAFKALSKKEQTKLLKAHQ